MKKTAIIISITIFMVSLKNVNARNDIPVNTIVDTANRVAYYQGKDARAHVKMTIIDSQGRKRNRRFTIIRSDDPPPKGKSFNKDYYCGNQKFYVYFHRPADVNKMSFMVWKNVNKNDDRWLYLPALDLVKRIASTENRTSFVGSNFFYEDVSGRNVDQDRHQLTRVTKNYYVLKNIPQNPKTVEFAYYNMWVHKTKFITVKVEYYDKNSEKYREYEALKIKTISGYPTVVKARMKDLHSKGETIIEYNNVKYNLNFPANIYTERSLRRPPLKYLKGR